MALTFSSRPALVAYITCGDPDLRTTREVALAAIEGGAEVLELGVPFSDPVADGPVIQRASERALRHHTSLADVLQLAGELRRQSAAGLIVFSYLNPILQFGLERFCDVAVQAGLDGALVVDLPVEEAGEYVRAMRARQLATVFLAAPTSPDRRLQRIAELSTGFVYAVSRTGVTGERKEAPQDARELVRRLRKYTRLPVAVGFGISTPQQFAAVGEYADAAAVGSAIVHTVERNPGREAAAVREFSTGLVGVRQERRTSASRA
jgi:tryptophan synthase alpha chain